MWSEQNAAIVFLAAFFTMVTLSNQARSPGLTASRALRVPQALWARHWTTGLRSSGSLSARHSTPGQPALSLTHTQFRFLSGFCFSPLTSHICSSVRCQGFSCFRWRTVSDEQHPVSVSWTSPKLVDSSFPSPHCWALGQLQGLKKNEILLLNLV